MFRRMMWVLSFVCSIPRWMDVYMRISVLCTAVTVSCTAALAIAYCFLTSQRNPNEKLVRGAMFVSNSAMLAMICLHFIVCTPAAMRHAAEKLSSIEMDRGSSFNPRSKLLDVKKAACIVCLSIILRFILLALRSISSFDDADACAADLSVQTNACVYCADCQSAAVVLSRIIENE